MNCLLSRYAWSHCLEQTAPCHECSLFTSRWFRCTACGRTLLGHGHFNPLREIDLDDIRSEAWKQLPGMEERFARLRRELGDAVADYYENGAFERNLELG